MTTRRLLLLAITQMDLSGWHSTKELDLRLVKSLESPKGEI